jgi:hypothetical protein
MVLKILLISNIFLESCNFAVQALAALRSTDHFISSKKDNRILYESGAEKSIERISAMLDSAIQQVENKQFQPFLKPVRIYICASRKSFIKMYGANIKAGVLTKLFLSPQVFRENDKILRRYLMHELSHLHFLQRLGIYRMSRLPFWFKEGMASYVSEGGGAHTVTEDQARIFFKSGKHFVPDESGGFIFQNTPGKWGLGHHMFYRQSMMFVEFLEVTSQDSFKNFLLYVAKGEKFSASLKVSFNKDLENLWHDFLVYAKNHR